MPLIKKNTQRVLDETRAAYVATEAKIGELHQQRQAALTDDAEADAIVAIDKKLADAGALLVVQQGKIEHLSARLDRELAEQKQHQREQAIGRVKAMLPHRIEMASQLEAALRSVADALRKFDESRSKIVKDWPDADLERPYATYLSTDRALAAVGEAFALFAPSSH
jgi:hypothetical protein